MSEITLITAILMFIALFCFCQPMLQDPEELNISIRKNQISSRLREGSLHVKIPVEKETLGITKGTLTVEVINLNDEAVAKTEEDFNLLKKEKVFDVEIPVGDISSEELLLHRIRYTLKSDLGTISDLRRIDETGVGIRILGQNEFLSGTQGSFRVIAYDHTEDKPLSGADIKLLLNSERLFTGKTNEKGTAEINFTVPDLPEDHYTLNISVATSQGDEQFAREIKISKSAKILLTTDKPLYQPNQTMHIRSLSLYEGTQKAVDSEPIILEVEDAKGNKVFKKRTYVNEFGVAAADFKLADEINMGDYKIRAIQGRFDERSRGLRERMDQPLGQAEKTVRVEEYVLPKFKINVSTDKDWYMPGETLKGEIQADYFFGKPVALSDVTINLFKFDVEFTMFEAVNTKTDKNGHGEFEVTLPTSFYGQPFEQGKAMVRMDVTVIDQADQEVTQTVTRTIVGKPFVVNALFEAGEYIPNAPQDFYVIVANPDGSAAENATIQIGKYNTQTDDMGIAIIPSDELPKSPNFVIIVSDKQGNKAEVPFNAESNPNGILLQTDKSTCDVGDNLNLKIFTPQDRFTAYVDVIQNKQTVLTKSLDLNRTDFLSQGEMQLNITPEMTGVLMLHGYVITEDSDIVRNTRLIYVNPASDLNIAIEPGKDSYLPGSDGKVNFTVTDEAGKGTVAAIGVQIVDEAVFALSEQQPGLAKVYFRLEEELMTPRYEIHAFRPKDLVMQRAQDRRKETAAKVLLASIQAMPDFDINVDTYKERRERYRDAFVQKVQEDADNIAMKLSDIGELTPGDDDSLYVEMLVKRGKLSKDDITDPWGNRYHIRFENEYQILVVSDGPDETPNTEDDIGIQAYIYQEKTLGAGVPRMKAVIPEAAAPDMAVMRDEAALEPMKEQEEGAAKDGDEPRLRKWFPETLFHDPAVITDEDGKATIEFPIADNITDWRITTLANSKTGQLGSQTGNLRVFQEFFVDLNLPVSLTQNDQVSIPVAIYNYLPNAQTVNLEFQKENWFELISDAKTSLKLQKDEVTVRYFTIKVKELGNHKLTVTARGSSMSDKIQKQIEVLPDGKEHFTTISDRLSGSVEKTIAIPEASIDGSAKLLVKIYPGVFSQVVEGLDAMLKMPFGCFEQTSATTYPNVLILNYMKETGNIPPEIQMKAEEYINVGYQRLLSYEVSGGGFEWFGNSPAHTFLTAFGLMEFYDMSKVHPVDENVITRTQRWLVSQQENDGSWSPISRYLDSAAQRFTDDRLRATAYVLWSLVETGYSGNAIDKAKGYVRKNIKDTDDPYTIAVAANAMLLIDKDDDLTYDLFKKLDEIKIEDGEDACYWSSEGSLSPSQGKTADLETTALAAYGLIKYGKYPKVTEKALNFIIKSKDQFGNWYNTQATVLSLKTLLASITGGSTPTNATVKISANGESSETIQITPENSDVLRQIDLSEFVKEGDNKIALDFSGEGKLMYQMIGKYYIPWEESDVAKEEVLSIDVDYDKTQLEKDDTVTCTAKIKNNTDAILEMVVVDLGIPPGFTVHSGDLVNLVEQKVIQKYNLTGRQIIVYFEKIDSEASVNLTYGLTADYPIKAKTTKSRAYLYYEPEKEAFAQPVEMVVKE